MQLCADVQDGLFEGAAHAEQPALAALLEADAVAWNAFADQLFRILLAVDHTSPDAKWKANFDRKWMNPEADLTDLNDFRICDECLLGLSLSKQSLQQAQLNNLPQLRELLQEQQRSVEDQVATLVRYVDCRPA
jgi:hypothetical protein